MFSFLFAKIKKGASLLLLAAVLTGMTGCSSFRSDWRDAARVPVSNADLAGRWQGSWKSEQTGHSGKLRCVITREPGADGSYRAHFHAKYLKILSFSYALTLHAKETQPGRFDFTGSADLGSLGGVYDYAGHAEGTNFFSTYSSKHDRGTFQMRRF